MLGQVLQGMKPTDEPVEGKKNDPMMPVAWVTTYTGTAGQACARSSPRPWAPPPTSRREGTRRLLVNAAYWAVGLEDKITDQTDVALVGDYHPLPFGFRGAKKGVKPEEHALAR